MRNNKGQFIKGHKETQEEKKKRVQAMIDSWKNQEGYLGDLRHTKLYTVWRSFMFTRKGKKAGHSDDWNDFKKFYDDNVDLYKDNLRLGRIDKELPFCKENCLWMTDYQLSQTRLNVPKFLYKGEKRTLREWSNIYGMNYSAMRQRVHKGWKDMEQIIFGRPVQRKKKIVDYSEHSFQGKKNKISKMISSYRTRDKKKGFITDLTHDWFYENIISKPCTYCESKEKVGCDRIDNSKETYKRQCIALLLYMQRDAL